MRSLGRSAIEEVEVDYQAVIGSRDGPLGVDPSEPASGILDVASAHKKIWLGMGGSSEVATEVRPSVG